MNTHHTLPASPFAPLVSPRVASGLVLGLALSLPLSACSERPQPKPPEAATPTAPPARDRVDRSDVAGVELADLGPLSTADSEPRLLQVAGIEAPKPATWIWQQPTMQFRTLQYSVPGMASSAAAEFIVSAFLADGGPIDGNLERWRNQFRDETGEAVEAAISKRDIGGLTVHLIDLRGSYMGMGAAAPRPGQVQRGAIIEAEPATIFLRLLGPAETVDAQVDAWQRLIDGLRRVAAE